MDHDTSSHADSHADPYAGPYAIFAQVLSHPGLSARLAALTGSMVSMYAEVNHLLAATKSGLARQVWAGCADEFERSLRRYENAWLAFRSEPDGGSDAGTRPGPEVREAFTEAVDGTSAVLEELRRHARSLGHEVW